MPPYLHGLALALPLIAAIGAQNAFVIRQGLRRERHLGVALVCAGCDALLIVTGVLLLGRLTAWLPGLTGWLLLAGAVFLLGYGARSLWSAFRGSGALTVQGAAPPAGRTYAAAAAFSLLNPHALLDTVVLIGGSSLLYAGAARGLFAAGAVSASLLWFLALALAAARLSPYLARPGTWRAVELLTAFVMWALAFKLLASR